MIGEKNEAGTPELLVEKAPAANIKEFHIPNEGATMVYHGTKMSQNSLIRLGKLQATLKVYSDVDTTQGHVIELALVNLENAIRARGIEIEPISPKMLANFKKRSKAIRDGIQKRKLADIQKQGADLIKSADRLKEDQDHQEPFRNELASFVNNLKTSL